VYVIKAGKKVVSGIKNEIGLFSSIASNTRAEILILIFPFSMSDIVA